MREIIIAFLSIITSCALNTEVIEIHTQSDFDLLPERIIDAIVKKKTNLKIRFSSGTYYYSQSMISFSNMNEDLSVSFVGKDVIFVPKHSRVKAINPSCVQFRGNELVNLWSEVVQSNELISVIDESNKLCKIRVSNGINANKGDYIQVSHWYKTHRYQVVSADNEYIYFTVDDLSYISEKSEWSINYDYIYAKKYPRYRVFCVMSHEDITQSSVTTFLDVSQAKLKDISLKGISFMGSAGSIVSKGLINFSNLSAQKINVENCCFTGCRSSCIKLENTSNLKVEDCVFYENYTTCVSAGPNCNNVSITNSLFDDNGKEWNNSHVILAQGSDFLISDNEFRDFCYGAIGAGIWYKYKQSSKVSGIIANNEIYYTDSYYKDYPKHTLMDSGGIYLWTQMDEVIIKYNYIHDIIGMEDNRGIFCDDGAKNVKILQNLVLRINNCYCIDLRNVPNVAKLIPDCNTGNHCINNLFDGRLRFFVKDDSCKKNGNLQIGQLGYKRMPVYKKWKYKFE